MYKSFFYVYCMHKTFTPLHHSIKKSFHQQHPIKKEPNLFETVRVCGEAGQLRQLSDGGIARRKHSEDAPKGRRCSIFQSIVNNITTEWDNDNLTNLQPLVQSHVELGVQQWFNIATTRQCDNIYSVRLSQQRSRVPSSGYVLFFHPYSAVQTTVKNILIRVNRHYDIKKYEQIMK